MKVGDAVLDLARPVVMTVLNVTPDSFFGGSRLAAAADVAAAARRAAADGAAILDIGGYSSRPGAADVSVDEETARVAAGFRAVRGACPDAVVSVDTFRAAVVDRIHGEFGPFIVNDISAGGLDAGMIATVAALGLPYIAMHMRSTPGDMQRHTDYGDVVDEVKAYLFRKVVELREAGVGDIIIDPGFGFAKTVRQNYQLLARLHELREPGCPVLAGVSRKSMIYDVLGSGPDGALAGTVALGWEALRRGASILRVHDTREAADTIKLFNYYNDAGRE